MRLSHAKHLRRRRPSAKDKRRSLLPRRAQSPRLPAIAVAQSPRLPALAVAAMANNWEADSSAGSKLTSEQTINTDGAWELYRYELLASTDCRIPKDWRVSDGGLAVPPIPRTSEGVAVTSLAGAVGVSLALNSLQPNNLVKRLLV